MSDTFNNELKVGGLYRVYCPVYDDKGTIEKVNRNEILMFLKMELEAGTNTRWYSFLWKDRVIGVGLSFHPITNYVKEVL